MIEMKIMGIALDTRTGSPIVVLNDKENTRALPIWIGSSEASSIIRQIEKIEVARPMTHDLICTILSETGFMLERVEIHDVSEETYFANLVLVNDLSASPSATRRSSYVSSLSRISSNAETSMNTYAARPFWVRINGRLVSFARDAQEASVVRNSLMEMISSDGLNSNMAFSPLVSMVNIVRNCVRDVKHAA